MSLSKFENPPIGHLLNRDYKIHSMDEIDIDTVTPILHTNSIPISSTPVKSDVILAIENKPSYSVYPNISQTYPTTSSSAYVKPHKTPEQIKKEEEDYKRKQKDYDDEINKLITVDVKDEHRKEEINDQDFLEMEFEPLVIPAEDGSTEHTYIQNYQNFAKIINNDFEVVMIYMATFLKTSYKCIKDNDTIVWYFEKAVSAEDIDNQRLHFISDIIKCDDCYYLNSVIVKDIDNNLIRICNSPSCNSTCPIKYVESDNEAENIKIKCMISEIINKVSLYSPITIQYSRRPRDKPDEMSTEDKKFYDELESALTKKHVSHSTNSFTPYGPYGSTNYARHTSGFSMMHNFGTHNSTNKWINNGKTNTVTHAPKNVYIPPKPNQTNKGYQVGEYGAYFKDKKSNIQSGTSYAQNLAEAKPKFGLEPTTDGREYYTYTNSKKDQFQSYVRFITAKIREHQRLIEKNPYNNVNTDESYWGLSTHVLLAKAVELDIMDIAVMANVMYLFDEYILKTNQLVTKRKYLVAFINNNPKVTSIHFLMGIECVINNFSEQLFTDVEEIMDKAYELKYFDINAYDEWYKTPNTFLVPEEFSQKLRQSLCNWRKTIAYSSDTASEDNASSGDDTTVVFNTGLFEGEDINQDMIDMLPDEDYHNAGLLLNTKTTPIRKQKHETTKPYTFNYKTFTLPNESNTPYLELSI